MLIKAAIFDLDGTLVQTEDLNAMAYVAVVRQLPGVEVPQQELTRLMAQQVGQTDASICRFLTDHLGLREALEPSMSQYRVQEPWQALLAMRSQAYMELISDT